MTENTYTESDFQALFQAEYEKTLREAFEEGEAIIAEAVRKAEARRRIHVDSDGCAVIAFVAAETADGGSTT